MAHFVPDSLLVKTEYDTDSFHFRKLSPLYAELDYEAVMTARLYIKTLYGIENPNNWPTATLELKDDIEDLRQHEEDYNNRIAFAYTVLSLDENKCLGCFYIDPCENEAYDALITLWGLDDTITHNLYRDVRIFVNECFSFSNPAFPVFEIPLASFRIWA